MGYLDTLKQTILERVAAQSTGASLPASDDAARGRHVGATDTAEIERPLSRGRHAAPEGLAQPFGRPQPAARVGTGAVQQG